MRLGPNSNRVMWSNSEIAPSCHLTRKMYCTVTTNGSSIYLVGSWTCRSGPMLRRCDEQTNSFEAKAAQSAARPQYLLLTFTRQSAVQYGREIAWRCCAVAAAASVWPVSEALPQPLPLPVSGSRTLNKNLPAAMDFPFNVNRLLPDSITKLTGDVQSYR